MRESVFETLIGLAVLVVAGVFVFFAFAQGSDASLAGVKVGTVRKVALNYERAEALVTMAVSNELFPISDGMTARVQSESLLGGNYINLEPAPGYGDIEPCGEGEEMFGESGCGELLYSQGSVDLLTLFASFATGSAGGDDSDDGGATNASAPTSSETASPDEDSDGSTEFGAPYPDGADGGSPQ